MSPLALSRSPNVLDSVSSTTGYEARNGRFTALQKFAPDPLPRSTFIAQPGYSSTRFLIGVVPASTSEAAWPVMSRAPRFDVR